MLRFLTKLLLLTLVLVALKTGLWAYIHTYRPMRSLQYEGRYKRDSLLKPNRSRINTVFVGSSRTAFGIIPSVFDSVTRHKTSSFNHGLSALLTPYTFTECVKLLQIDSLKLKTIFFELSVPNEATHEDPFDKDNVYDEIALKTKLLLREEIPEDERIRRGLEMYNSYLNGLLTLKGPVSIFMHSLNRKKDENFVMTPSGHRYFRQYKGLAKRNEGIPAEKPPIPVVFQNRLTPKETLYRSRLDELIRKCHEKNVAIYFFLPTKLTPDEKRFFPHFWAMLPPQYRIDIPIRNQLTPPFPTAYSDDGVHLNPTGATLYSQLFAEAFIGKFDRDTLSVAQE